MSNYKVGQVVEYADGSLHPILSVNEKEQYVLVLNDSLDSKILSFSVLNHNKIKEYFMENTEKVDHPSHYNREGAIECIDEMILIFGKEAVKHFCILNAWKYRYRATDKNGEEDLKKSDWYINKLKEIDPPIPF